MNLSEITTAVAEFEPKHVEKFVTVEVPATSVQDRTNLTLMERLKKHFFGYEFTETIVSTKQKEIIEKVECDEPKYLTLKRIRERVGQPSIRTIYEDMNEHKEDYSIFSN